VALPVEQPQLRLSIAGVAVPGAVSLEIESVAYFSADRFRIGFAMGAAAFTTAAYFAGLGLQTIKIEAALSGFGYVTLLTGQIDNVRIDLARNIAELCGRDLSARLIDSEISETFANQSSSQIASTIAARHQLTANVTATQTMVGQYYELDHARNALGAHSRATTEWNLLTELAALEDFVVSVTGTTLNFGPVAPGRPVFVTPRSFTALSLDVATTIPMSARVKSWNTRQKAVVSERAGSGAGTTLIRPNLTVAQARSLATNHLATLRQHGTMLVGTMPADLTLMPGMQLVLSGTESGLDQTYDVSAVSRVLEARTGFLQTVLAFGTS
jgi:hypothetical protein